MEYPRPVTDDTKKEITELFADADLSLIREILYFDGWSDYEESGGILVFRAIDDSIQIADYGYCVMAEDNTNRFYLREVSLAEAQQEIKEMEAAINKEVTNGGL